MKKILASLIVLSAGAITWTLWPSSSPTRGVLLIGVDGADWDILDPLIGQGRLPHLARLKQEGASGPLRTLDDIPLSPVVWTSVVTGKGPAEHGITWFLVDAPDGRRIPVRSHNRRVKALWNILHEQGQTPGVVGWWATAPAEDVGPGVIVSDALGFHGFGRAGVGIPDAEKVHPAPRFDEFNVLMPPVQQIDYGHAERFFHMSAEDYYGKALVTGRTGQADPANPIHLFQEATATTLGYTEIARRLLEDRSLDFVSVYYESTDSVSHLFMKYAPPRQTWVDETDFDCFRDVVDRYYEFFDEQLGRLLVDLPEDWAVVLVSDHGFRIGDERPRSIETVDIRGAHLDHAPEGILVAWGPHIAKGATLDGGSVLDVTPTLLQYLGVPVARDMAGRVLTEIFEPGFVDAHPIQYVTTYEGGESRGESATTSSPAEARAAEQAMERLRTLGYVDDGGEPAAAQEEITSPEQINAMGRIHLQNGDLDAARREFERALARFPGDPEAHANLGVLALARGDQGRALQSFSAALLANPNHVPTLLQVAEIRQARNEHATAEALYRQALAIDDRLPAPYLGLGDCLLRQGRVPAALEQFVVAVGLDPRSVAANYNLGVAHAELGDREQARASYEAALALAPEHALAHNNLGDLLLRDGNTAQAQEHFRRAADADPSHMESRFNLGSTLLQQGQFDDAIRWLEQAALLRPDLEVAQNRLAQAYLEAGRIDEATQRYELQVRLYPGSANPCVQLARIALTRSDTDQAVAWLHHAWKRGGEPVRQAILQDPEFQHLDRAAIFANE